MDRWITEKINDSSSLLKGSSWNWMWEEDKVGWRCGKVKGKLEVYLCLGEFDLQLGSF